MIYWIYLTFAILFEVAGTICMKLSEGFSRLWPSILLFVFYIISLTLLPLALKKIDVSIAYAIWSAVGTALIVIIGIMWFKEAVTTIKMISIALIIVGVIGLQFSNSTH